eukprot:g148.t1
MSKISVRNEQMHTRNIRELLKEREEQLQLRTINSQRHHAGADLGSAHLGVRRGSSVMPIVVDNLDHGRPKYVIHSDSKVRLAWDSLLMTLLVYIAIVTPYRIGLNDPPSGGYWYWEVVIDFFFLVDVALNFRTGFELDTGEEEMRPREIARHYLRGWFLIDLVSSIPVELLFAEGGEVRSLKLIKASKILRVLRILKLAKLLRIFKTPKLVEIVEEHLALSQEQTKGIKMLVTIFFVAHIIACGWGFLGTQHSQSSDSCFVGTDVCSSNWLDKYQRGIMGRPAGSGEVYSIALYWSFTTITTVGFGDIVPHTETERYYTIFAMICGVGFYGYFIATMAALLQNLDANEARYLEKMSAINSYMRLRGFPRKLRLRVKRYYKNYFSRKTALDEGVILSELSTFLRREVAMFLLSDIIYTIPFIKGRDPNVLAKILTILKPIAVMPGDNIMEEGEPGEEMYIVVSGELQVVGEGDTTKCVLGKGRFFGELFRNHPQEIEDMKRVAQETYAESHAVDHIPMRFSHKEQMEKTSSQTMPFVAGLDFKTARDRRTSAAATGTKPNRDSHRVSATTAAADGKLAAYLSVVIEKKIETELAKWASVAQKQE